MTYVDDYKPSIRSKNRLGNKQTAFLNFIKTSLIFVMELMMKVSSYINMEVFGITFLSCVMFVSKFIH